MMLLDHDDLLRPEAASAHGLPELGLTAQAFGKALPFSAVGAATFLFEKLVCKKHGLKEPR